MTVPLSGLSSAWDGIAGSSGGVVLRVLVVGVLLGVTLYWVQFGAADPTKRSTGRYSYGVFAVVWTVTMAVYFTVI